MTEPVENWDPISGWWTEEVATDPLYEEDIRALLEILLGRPQGVVADLGCGEGQWLRWLTDARTAGAGTAGTLAFGCDLSKTLLGRAARSAPVVRCRLPDLGWLRDGSIDAAFSVYVADLIVDLDRFLAETSRVVRDGGTLTVIVNHPVFTAPGSAPFMDQDREVLFRWGEYFGTGSSVEPAGDHAVEFHHRSMARWLTAAAAAGWALERLEERGLSREAIARDPGYAGQEQIPRILGVTWTRRPDAG